MALQKAFDAKGASFPNGYWRIEEVNLVIGQLWAHLRLHGYADLAAATAYRAAQMAGQDPSPYGPLTTIDLLPDQATVFGVVSSNEGENLATTLYEFAAASEHFAGAENV